MLKIIQRRIHRIALEESVCMCSGALKGRAGSGQIDLHLCDQVSDRIPIGLASRNKSFQNDVAS